MTDVALAAEISEDRRHAAVAVAGREAAGPRLVAVLAWYDHPRDVAAVLADLWAERDPVAVVVDGRSQAATLLGPLADLGIQVIQPTPSDVAVAHGQFLDLVRDGGLVQLDQPELTMAVRAAIEKPLAGAQALARVNPVDQSPLKAVEFATWAFRRWEESADAGVWFV